jgi:hypothetical protein
VPDPLADRRDDAVAAASVAVGVEAEGKTAIVAFASSGGLMLVSTISLMSGFCQGNANEVSGLRFVVVCAAWRKNVLA